MRREDIASKYQSKSDYINNPEFGNKDITEQQVKTFRKKMFLNLV